MKTRLLQAVFITSSLAKNIFLRTFFPLDFAEKLKLKEFTEKYIFRLDV